ncbi:hypothetical protein [Nocardia concava]|uniref:hypothetical protein n=1 Tax=Nocardia concava TaxID=257281 RepID=UPI0012FB4578|nr:hypothetical protein [Nocardia concava]
MKWSALPSEQAQRYIEASLRDGLELSKEVLETLELSRYDLCAGTSEALDSGDLTQFAVGTARPTVIGARLAAELCARFPTRWLVLEMPLAHPTDRFVENSEDEGLVVWHESVYAVCRLEEGPERARWILLQHDSSFSYRAFLTDHEFPPLSADGQSIGVEAIVVGAYDGEGVVAAVRR